MRVDLRKTMPLLLASCLLAGGCLLKETIHTLYLSPEGGVTWAVLERDVRSDRTRDEERRLEEREYLKVLRSGNGPQAEALRALGGRRVRTTLLRDERPYAALTEAEFISARRMVEDLLDGLGVEGDVQLQKEPNGMHFSLTVRAEQDSDIEEDHPMVALLEDNDAYRIVLTEGRFTGAGGFELDASKTIATLAPDSLDPVEAQGEGAGEVTFWLTWR